MSVESYENISSILLLEQQLVLEGEQFIGEKYSHHLLTHS